MQIGIRLHDLDGETLAERLDCASRMGFECVHLAFAKAARDLNVSPSGLTTGLGSWLQRELSKRNLSVAVLGCYLNLATNDRLQLPRTVEDYKAHLRFSRLLGGCVVGTETGAPNAEYRFEPACHTTNALELLIERLRPVVRMAEQLGALIAIEPVYRHIVSTPERARAVLDAIGSPNLRVILDPVNLLHESNYLQRDEIINRALLLLGPSTEVLHLKDYRMENGVLTACAAGTGDMDFLPILRYVKQNKPYLYATLENVTPLSAASAKDFILSEYQRA